MRAYSGLIRQFSSKLSFAAAECFTGEKGKKAHNFYHELRKKKLLRGNGYILGLFLDSILITMTNNKYIQLVTRHCCIDYELLHAQGVLAWFKFKLLCGAR